MREPRYVLWLDPGVTTGVALYDLRHRTIELNEYGFNELVVRLELCLRGTARETVVGCERFVIMPDTARRLGSVDAIQAWGAARSAAVRHLALGWLDHQTSGVAKTFCPDRVLRALGWYSTTMGHANDAARHVLYYLAQTGQLSQSERAMLRPAVNRKEDEPGGPGT